MQVTVFMELLFRIRAAIASEIKGIYSDNGEATDFYNNMISLGSTVTAGHNIYGIYNTQKVTYYNSVVISEALQQELLMEEAMPLDSIRASTEAVVMNNIFVNTRTNDNYNNNWCSS